MPDALGAMRLLTGRTASCSEKTSPSRDLPENYGLYTTCYNRFVRWRQAGIWDQTMEALAVGHDAAVQMIDTSVARVHQHGACIADNNHQDMGRSRGRVVKILGLRLLSLRLRNWSALITDPVLHRRTGRSRRRRVYGNRLVSSPAVIVINNALACV